MDVTSGIVGHLLFMGRGPVCENVCLSLCTRSQNLPVMLHSLCDKVESFIYAC